MKKIAAFATTTVLLVAAGGAAASAREAEPLGDHGTSVTTVHAQPATIEAGDDDGTEEVEPGDEAEAGDDHGGDDEVEAGDDHGGHGSDD